MSKNVMLFERSISLAELLTIKPLALIAERHTQATTIIRTTIDGSGIDILNLLPPQGRVFWSFGLYATQDSAAYSFANSNSVNALARIDSEIGRLKVQEKSINAYEFLGPFTKREGDKYFPYSGSRNPVPYWWFAQRHLYLSCPTEQYEQCVKYFSDQISEVGDDCFRSAPDERVLVDMSQYVDYPDYIHLQKYVTRLSKSERAATCRALVRDDFLENADSGVIEIAGCRGEGAMALMEDIENYDDADCIRAILIRRAELAVQYMALPNIETVRNQIANDGICSDSRATRKMLSVLNERLSPFPIIDVRIE